MVGKIWPAYSWDGSPSIFALLVPLQTALDELNFQAPTITEGELERALISAGLRAAYADILGLEVWGRILRPPFCPPMTIIVMGINGQAQQGKTARQSMSH